MLDPLSRPVWKHLVAELLELGGGHADLISHCERDWASATFWGSRHTIRLQFTGAEGIAAGERLIDALPDHEFTLARHLVADATITTVDHVLLPFPTLTVEAELLLLDEA